MKLRAPFQYIGGKYRMYRVDAKRAPDVKFRGLPFIIGRRYMVTLVCR